MGVGNRTTVFLIKQNSCVAALFSFLLPVAVVYICLTRLHNYSRSFKWRNNFVLCFVLNWRAICDVSFLVFDRFFLSYQKVTGFTLSSFDSNSICKNELFFFRSKFCFSKTGNEKRKPVSIGRIEVEHLIWCEFVGKLKK